jgi:hypothetical protein
MHLGCSSVVLLAGALLLASVPARADETFLCQDGSSVTVDSSNRAAMQDHPCVRAWFVNDLAHRQALAGDRDGKGRPKTQPAVHRYTVRRALALRDLQNRPAYLAWSRSRTVAVASYTRKDGTNVKSHLRSAPTQARHASFRLRFRRR